MPLLYLPEQDRVVSTTIKFCLKEDCCTNIKSKFNNIRELNELKVNCSFKDSLTEEEKNKLNKKRFELL